MVIFNLLGQI